MKIDIQKEREAFNDWLKHYDKHEVKIDQLQRAFMWQAWQAKAQAVPECKWSKNQDGFYDTSCTNAFVFPEPEDTPKDHDFTHCPFCGGKLSEPQEST